MQEPSGYKALNTHEIDEIITTPAKSKWMPKQEKGMRKSCALPYELYADGKLNADKTAFDITFATGNKLLGNKAVGAPFNVYAPGSYRHQKENGQSITNFNIISIQQY